MQGESPGKYKTSICALPVSSEVAPVEKSGKSKIVKGKGKEKENVGVKATKKPKKDEKKKGKGKQVVEEDEEDLDVDMEAGGSSEGWEDVEDGVDLKAEARSVYSSCGFSSFVAVFKPCFFGNLGHYFMMTTSLASSVSWMISKWMKTKKKTNCTFIIFSSLLKQGLILHTLQG